MQAALVLRLIAKRFEGRQFRTLRGPGSEKGHPAGVFEVKWVGFPVLIRTAIAERRYSSDNQFGKLPGQLVTLEATGRTFARRHVMHQDICFAQQPRKDLTTFGPIKRQLNPALVGVEVEEQPTLLGIFLVVRKWSPPPRAIAAGRFDL